MPLKYLHEHPQFADLLAIVANEESIDPPSLIEKDYWIMHCLFGLQANNLKFQMKGGTSLSKGFGLINRFSEDIDIQIEPPSNIKVYTGRNQDKSQHIQSRLDFYDWLAENIKIDGINAERDRDFDDEKARSGGIRLFYTTTQDYPKDLKEGILLEVGFDDVRPNVEKNISSWAYDYACEKVEIKDNRAKAVACYHPGYTLVEKLQTVSTKYRKQQEAGGFPENFMRHYYDIFCLLKDKSIQEFISSPDYIAHKEKRFRTGDNLTISQNEAFILSDLKTRALYEGEYQKSTTLYYREKPSFESILSLIREYSDRL